MIVSLLAVLELVRLQAIILVQQELFSKIWLRKHKMFDVVFAGGESIADSLAEPLRGIDEEYQ
jgi:chromatin segregation and condensation protein Rec8/ScpA/Scc1 (kleisin family)